MNTLTLNQKKLLICQLRHKLQVTEDQVSDVELLDVTNGTLLRKRIELVIGIDNLEHAIQEAIQESWFLKLIWKLWKPK